MRRNPTKEQREKEAKKFKEWNEKHPAKFDGVLTHPDRTEYIGTMKGNRE
jgi:hypothetical protein